MWIWEICIVCAVPEKSKSLDKDCFVSVKSKSLDKDCVVSVKSKSLDKESASVKHNGTCAS